MTSYSIVQKQQLSQLGAYLQEKRQEQGKSLEDISLQTYIRTQLLRSLENGDPSDLPQPIFVQGFIRRYADALGLDGTNFAKQFPVHSIPDTPRPVPRPATPIDLAPPVIAQKPVTQKPAAQKPTAQKPAAQKPAVQTQSNQPNPRVGALPIQTVPTLDPAMERVGISKSPAPEAIVPEEIAPEKTAPETASDKTPKAFTLDPTPMSDSDLATVGLSDLDDSIDTQIGTDIDTQQPTYQSAPFSRETTPEFAPESAPEISPDSTTPEIAPENTPELTPKSTPASGPNEIAATQKTPGGSLALSKPVPVEPAAPIRGSLSNNAPTSAINWLPWGIGAAVLVGAIALGANLIGGGSNPPAESTETTAAQTDTDSAQTPPPAIEAPDPEVETAPISEAPVNLTIEITEAGPSWMSIEIDGELAFEGLMDPGMTETWEGQESITMNVGNAGAALVSSNGSEPTPAGNPGGAEFLIFTVDE